MLYKCFDNSCNQTEKSVHSVLSPTKGLLSLQGNLDQVNNSNFPNSWLGDTVRGAVRVAGPWLVCCLHLNLRCFHRQWPGEPSLSLKDVSCEGWGWIKAGWGQSEGGAGPGVRSFHLPPIRHHSQPSHRLPAPAQPKQLSHEIINWPAHWASEIELIIDMLNLIFLPSKLIKCWQTLFA